MRNLTPNPFPRGKGGRIEAIRLSAREGGPEDYFDDRMSVRGGGAFGYQAVQFGAELW